MRKQVRYDDLTEREKEAIRQSLTARMVAGATREQAASDEATRVCDALLMRGAAPGHYGDWAERLVAVADAVAETGCPAFDAARKEAPRGEP